MGFVVSVQNSTQRLKIEYVLFVVKKKKKIVKDVSCAGRY